MWLIQFLQKLKNVMVHFLAVYSQSQSFTCTCLGEMYHKVYYFCTQYKTPFYRLALLFIYVDTSMFSRNIKLQKYKGNTFCLLSEEGRLIWQLFALGITQAGLINKNSKADNCRAKTQNNQSNSWINFPPLNNFAL